MIKTSSRFPSHLTIDDEIVKVTIKRMTNREFDQFAEGFNRWTETRGPGERRGSSGPRRGRRPVDAGIARRVSRGPARPIEHDGAPLVRSSQLVDIFGARRRHPAGAVVRS